MTLRPTESPVLFLQQLGRELRIAEGKRHLAVLDITDELPGVNCANGGLKIAFWLDLDDDGVLDNKTDCSLRSGGALDIDSVPIHGPRNRIEVKENRDETAKPAYL